MQFGQRLVASTAKCDIAEFDLFFADVAFGLRFRCRFWVWSAYVCLLFFD